VRGIVSPHAMTDPPSRPDVTGLLLQWRDGKKDALDRLVPIVYVELRRLARAVAACRCWCSSTPRPLGAFC
jgi:hypothetical protein